MPGIVIGIIILASIAIVIADRATGTRDEGRRRMQPSRRDRHAVCGSTLLSASLPDVFASHAQATRA